jgi:glycosyltransferase involved in cell wall biosynthesis
MKVLFVRSGNSGIDPISTRQGESLRKAGVEIHYFDISGKGLTGYLKNLPLLRRYVKETGVEIIHAHYSLSGIIAALSFSGRKVVTSLMGSDVMDSSFSLLSVIRFFSPYFWDITIVKTLEMKEKLGIRNALVIPNGVDMELFYPKDKLQSQMLLGWASDKKHILFSSDPQRIEKNYSQAQRALGKISESYSGRSPEIHFLSGVSPDEVVNYYSAADLLLVTSTHEGSSNTIKEAMACNCPIVTTGVGDARQVISDTEGCFVTSFDPDDVASAIIRAMDFGIRTDGRTRIEHLSSERIALQISGLYSELLKNRTR